MSIIITEAYSAADHDFVQGLMRTLTSEFLEMPQGTHSTLSCSWEDISQKTHSSAVQAAVGVLHPRLKLDHCAEIGQWRETYQVPVGHER